MSIVTELIDRLPVSDGGLRRRFNNGVLFFLVLTVGIFWFPGIPSLAEFLFDTFLETELNWIAPDSITIVIVSASVLFVLGNLIDIMGDVLLRPIYSVVGGIYVRLKLTPITKVSADAQPKRTASGNLPHVRIMYAELPDYVKEGLTNPYRRQFIIAFRYLIHITPNDEKIWLQQIDSRNKNLFSLVSSISLAVLTVSVLTFAKDVNPYFPHSAYNLNSTEARGCYSDLVRDIAKHSPEFSQISGRLLNSIQDRVRGPIDYLDTYVHEKAPEHISDTNQIAIFRHGFNQCQNILPPGTKWTDVPLQEVGFVAFATLSFLILLAITHAVMLADAILGALEMLCLRRAIDGDPSPPVEKGGHSYDDTMTNSIGRVSN